MFFPSENLIVCPPSSPSAGYSPTAPGYSPSSTSQYTPQTSDKDDRSRKDDRNN